MAKMKEELTTKMHSEFLKDSVSGTELKVMGVYGAISRGVSREKALAKYGLTDNQYEKLKDKYLL